MEISKSHVAQYRVYFEDTDQMGVVYHANFLCFFERSRTEMLRNSGFSLNTMAIYGTHFAIYDIHIRYIYPARLDDLLTITTHLQGKRACSLMFKQTMHNQAGNLLSEADVEVVCVDQHLKPKRLSSIPFVDIGGSEHG